MTTRILYACLAGAGLIAPLQARRGRDCQNGQAAEKGIGAFTQRNMRGQSSIFEPR